MNTNSYMKTVCLLISMMLVISGAESAADSKVITRLSRSTPDVTKRSIDTRTDTCINPMVNTSPVQIPDEDEVTGVTSSVYVTDGGTVTDVNVMVNITHPYVKDLSGYLISPLGTRVTLFSRQGGSYSNFAGLILDDEAALNIDQGTSPFTGNFKPFSALSAFDGEIIYGEWKLVIMDHIREDKGTLDSWRLDICYSPLTDNHPPIANSDRISTVKNTPVSIYVLGNDYDPNEDPLTIVSVSDPDNGSTQLSSGIIIYTPDIGFTGMDNFSYTISDGSQSATANVIVAVGQREQTYSSPDTPIAIPDWKTEGVQSVIPISETGILMDINIKLTLTHEWFDDLSVYLISPLGTRVTLFEHVQSRGETSVAIIIDDDASKSIAEGIRPFLLSYRPKAPLLNLKDEPISGNWRLLVIDDLGDDQGTLNSWQLQVFYLPLSESQFPVIQDDVVDTSEDQPMIIDVLKNDYDLSGASLVITEFTPPQHGSVKLNPDKTLTYTPTTGFIGEDTFVYHASNGNKSSSGDVKIYVGRKTYISPNTQQTIPDKAGIASIVFVPVLGSVRDVNVSVNISHPCIQDLKAWLVSPKGTKVILFEHVGGKGNNFSDTRFDDEAEVPIDLGVPPFNTSFRPMNPLSHFDDEDISGEWRLEVYDDTKYDVGILNYWKLEIAYNPITGPHKPVLRDDVVNTSIVYPYPLIIDVLSNDSTQNGSSLTIINISPASHGTVDILGNNMLSYTPEPCFCGDETFQYTVKDSYGETEIATVKISVDGNLVNDGSFEAGTPNFYWTQSSICWNNSPLIYGNAYDKNYMAWFQSCEGKESAHLEQSVFIPKAEQSSLSFRLVIYRGDVEGYLKVKLDDQEVFVATQADASTYSSWTEVIRDVSSFADGNSHTLRFENVMKAVPDTSGQTSILVDAIALTVNQCRTTDSATLENVITLLKLLTKIPISQLPNVPTIDPNGKVGIKEIISMMQEIAGLR